MAICSDGRRRLGEEMVFGVFVRKVRWKLDVDDEISRIYQKVATIRDHKGLSLYLNDIKDKISSKAVASTILAACSDINTQGGWKGDRYGSAFLIELEKTLSA